jgi:hypothetical protein
MSLHHDLLELKNQGSAQAETLWATLTQKFAASDPVNIYKAVCTIKSAELLTRLRHSDGNDLPEFLKAIGTFVDASLSIAGGGQSGDQEVGATAIRTLEELFPISEEDFTDPSRFAIRQHTLDGLLLLSSKSFSKEQETRQAIETLQQEFMRIVLGGMIQDLVGEKPRGDVGNA